MAFVPQLFTAPPSDPFLLRMALLRELSRRGIPFNRLQEFLPFAHAPQTVAPRPSDQLPAGTTLVTPPEDILPPAQRVARTPAELAVIAANQRRAIALSTPEGHQLPTIAVPSRDGGGFGWRDIVNAIFGTSRGPEDDPFGRVRRPPSNEPVPLQTGGIVTQPTVALLGEAGPEAVVPLTPEQRVPLASEQIEPLPRPQFNDAQWQAIRAAPEGARIRVDDGAPYVKRGQQLVREPRTFASTAAETGYPPAGLSGTALAGAGEAVTALPGLAMTALGTPSRVGGEVAELVRSPRTMGPQIWENAKQFALGLTGFPESLRTVFGRSTPHDWQQLPETFVREAARTATSLVLTGGLGRLAKGAVRGALGPRSLVPGVAKGAEKTLHELAVPRARQLAADLRPLEGATDRAYADLAAIGNPRLSMSGTVRRAQELLDDQLTASPSLRDTTIVSDLQDIISDAQNGWQFQRLKANQERLGAQLGSSPTAPIGVQRLKATERASLMEAIYGDLEEARPMLVKRTRETIEEPSAAGLVGEHGAPLTIPRMVTRKTFEPGEPTEQTLALAPQFQLARKSAHRDFASTDLLKMIDKGMRKGGKIDADAVLKSIDDTILAAGRGERKARLFVGAWEPGELNAVKASLRSIGESIPQPRGVVRQAVEHGASASVGAMIGGPVGAAIGAVVPELIAGALMTPVGRSLIRRAARIDGGIGPTSAHALAALLRAQAAAERGELSQ